MQRGVGCDSWLGIGRRSGTHKEERKKKKKKERELVVPKGEREKKKRKKKGKKKVLGQLDLGKKKFKYWAFSRYYFLYHMIQLIQMIQQYILCNIFF